MIKLYRKTPKYMAQKMTGLKGEIVKSIITVGNFIAQF